MRSRRARIPLPRAMSEEKQDFDAKLLMIEELARLSLDEDPGDAQRNRLEAIAVTARLLRLRLQLLTLSVSGKAR